MKFSKNKKLELKTRIRKLSAQVNRTCFIEKCCGRIYLHNTHKVSRLNGTVVAIGLRCANTEGFAFSNTNLKRSGKYTKARSRRRDRFPAPRLCSLKNKDLLSLPNRMESFSITESLHPAAFLVFQNTLVEIENDFQLLRKRSIE